jgi:hypothetical protein
LQNFLVNADPVLSYVAAINDKNLLLLLKANEDSIPTEGLHFAPLRYLIEKNLIADEAFDEAVPMVVDLKEPLGKGKPYLWVTFKESIDFHTSDATQIRNLLGLYCIPVQFKKSTWIPSVFDAFGMPPYRPVSPGAEWGLTRNLVDDSIGVPELLIAPLETLSESPTAYLVEPRIDDPPPEGWLLKRLANLNSNVDYANWRY